MMITNEGTIIRTGVASINTYSRTASGVRVMNVDEGAVIANIVRIAPENALSSEDGTSEGEIVDIAPADEAPEVNE